MIKAINKDFAVIFILLCLSIFLNVRSFNYFYFQDDFFNFNITQGNSISSFLNLFKFRDDIIAYRPISLQLYFFILQQFSGFNSYIFRISTFGIFAINFLLIVSLVSKIGESKKIGLLTGALWLFSSIHFMSLSQINYNMIGTFFFLLTSLWFLTYTKNHQKIFYILSIISFLFALGSYEFAVTWPLIFGFYYLIVNKNLKKLTKFFSPYLFITFLYFFLRSIYIKIPSIVEYKVEASVNSLKALFWYFLWTLNTPEEFKKQIVSRLIIFNERFLSEYWLLVSVTFIGVLWIIFLGIVVPAYYILRKKININWKLIILSLSWFLIGLSPVLLLPNHNFIMYLTMPSIGLYFLISYLLIKSKIKILPFIVIIIWVFMSKNTLDFYHKNSYIVESQKFSRSFYVGIKSAFPNLPGNSAVYYPVTDIEKQQAIMDQEAIKAIFKDSTISIYYNKESLLKDFQSGRIIGPVYIYTN